MGFDCTFHVIDENAIRDRFVPKLLERTAEETELDRVMEESESLWEQAQDRAQWTKPRRTRRRGEP